MATNEERREVARKLRSEKCPFVIWVSSVRLAIGVDNETDGNDILDCLADLIEPEQEQEFEPVHEEVIWMWGGREQIFRCGACNAIIFTTFSAKEYALDLARNFPKNGIRYCQKCGKKVAGNDD